MANPPCGRVGRPNATAGSALGSSQACPHPNTDQALRRFIPEVGMHLVGSIWYGMAANEPNPIRSFFDHRERGG